MSGCDVAILALADAGAVARVVRDGGFGLVVPPGDVERIAHAIADLYRDRDRLGTAAADNPKVTDFDARRQSGLMADILEALLPASPALAPSNASREAVIPHGSAPRLES